MREECSSPLENNKNWFWRKKCAEKRKIYIVAQMFLFAKMEFKKKKDGLSST